MVKDLWALRLPLILENLKTSLDKPSDAESGTDQSPKLYSSQNDTTDIDSEDEQKLSWERKAPSVLDSVGICYIAMTLLRIPSSLGDYYRWASIDQSLHLQPLKLIPVEMRRQLPIKYLSLLETTTAIRPDRLHKSVFDLIALYKRHFKLEIPPLNYPHLLFHYIHELALPIQVFTIVNSLSALLSNPFSFAPPKFRQPLTTLPELRLLSLLIIALKLNFPFDGYTRYARSITSAGYLKINWTHWLEVHSHLTTVSQSQAPFLPGGEAQVKESDVFSLSNEKLDSYMDWYERTFIDERSSRFASNDLERDLIDLFPTGRHSSQPAAPVRIPDDETDLSSASKTAIVDAIKAVQGAIEPRGVISDERAESQPKPLPRIGDGYRIYRKEEELEGDAKGIFEIVARKAGISVRLLLDAVWKTERKLMVWKEKRDKEDDGLAERLKSTDFSEGRTADAHDAPRYHVKDKGKAKMT